MRSVQEIPILHNIPVLVRAALNEPIENGVVQDSFRLRRALPTLRFLTERGARVVVASHIGEAGTETLKPVVDALSKMISGVSFCEVSIGPLARKAVRDLAPGRILVLENLRRNPGEVAGDTAFARELASLADVFVQDSFDTCHRVHASIVGVPTLLPSYAGLVLVDEVRELTKALTPKSPSFAIIGGAKFSTKEPVLSRLLEVYDKVFVGGALANDFLQAQGQNVGKSLVSNASADKIKPLLANPRLVLPIDSHIEDTRIVDHGPKTAELLAALVQKSKTVLWNGPLGEYEKGFFETTDKVAEAIAKSGAYSIVGGGDTVAEIERLNLLDRFSFVSTGGGAMLDFLTRGTLPGIAALG
ncbi:MAG: phosphoglycerate kinase [bacterium]|nr:phosphoglycerate kinase [bacterium]